MPTNIADVQTFTSPIQVPADGDAANAASVATAFQGLSNRTAYLRAMVDQGGTGAYRPFREVASPAALQNVSGQQDGDYVVCLAVPGTLPYGVYRFYSAFSASNGFFEIPSLNASGTWVMVGVGWALIGSQNGIATLDGTGKLVEPTPNRIVGEWYSSVTLYTLTSSGADIGPVIEAPSLQVGDVVTGHVSYSYGYGTGGSLPCTIYGYVQTSQNGGSYGAVRDTSISLTAATNGPVNGHFRQQVSVGGTFRAKMTGFRISGGSTDSRVANALLTISVVRP